SGQRLSHRVTRLVMPERKVVNLNAANTDQDSQNLITGCLKRERRIKTRATLLNEREVKSRGISDCLDALGRGPCRNWRRWHHSRGRCVGVVYGNGGLIQYVKRSPQDS